MQSKWLLSSALVGCLAFGWCAHLLTAQHRKPVTITRIYTGSDGETHAEEITGNLKSDPSRNGIEFSDPIKVTSLVFARTSPGWVRDWHQETYRQYLITLSGQGEFEISGGHKVSLAPGSIVLVEDSTGKGHISRTFGTEDRIALNIRLADR